MTYKQKLIDLLKSDEQTKQSMEKLEFGCKFIFDGIEFIYSGNKNADESILEGIESGDTKIIGLPLQERFITMYLEKVIGEFNHYNVDYKGIFLHIEDESIYIEVDNNKDFDNQSEEVYQKIYEELIKLI